MIKFAKLRDVKTPKKAYYFDAGYDFFVPNDFKETVLNPNQSVKVPSGIKIEVPEGLTAIFLNRSSIAADKALLVGAQVIDHGYMGEVHLNLHNVGKSIVLISPGLKLIQLLFMPIYASKLSEVDLNYFDKKTDRGENGFGSTGEK